MQVTPQTMQYKKWSWNGRYNGQKYHKCFNARIPCEDFTFYVSFILETEVHN